MEFLRHRWRLISVLAIFLALLLFVVLPWGYKSYVKSKQAKAAQQENPKIDLDKMYNDARKDIKDRKYDDAVGKLESLASIAPKYKQVKALLNEARKKRQETASELPPSQRPPDSDARKNGDGGDNKNDTVQGGLPRRNSPKEIVANATPISLLPEKLDGFKTVERRWESKPIEAAGRYDPIDEDVKDKIEMVWIVISKWESGPDAEERFNYQKGSFPENHQSLGINGHSALFGLTYESRPDFFPAVATLSWQRVNWFFGVEVVPISTPSTDYKKAISQEVAAEFGY